MTRFSRNMYGIIECPVCKGHAQTAYEHEFIKLIIEFAENLCYPVITPADLKIFASEHNDMFGFFLGKFVLALQKHRTLKYKMVEDEYRDRDAIAIVPQLTDEMQLNSAYDQIESIEYRKFFDATLINPPEHDSS